MSVTDAEVISGSLEGLPAGLVVQDSDILASYSVDRAMYCSAGKALALVHVRDTAHVQQVMLRKVLST